MGLPANIDALVSSRICHDLISPVGAISNGIELMGELAPPTPEIALIGESVDNATAKLQFFRVCFGQAADDAVMGTPEVVSLGTRMLETPRLTISWQMASEVLPRNAVRLLFLALLCVETGLPVGGQISAQENAGQFSIFAEGKRIQIGDAWKLLRGEPVAAFTPAEVQFPLLQNLAHSLHRPIKIDVGETSLRITL